MNEAHTDNLLERCNGFSVEEQQLVAMTLPSKVLVEELMRRLDTLDCITQHIHNTSAALKGELIHVK